MYKSSKAEHIRRIFKEMGPGTESGLVRERLKKQGIAVTPQQTANEKRKIASRSAVVAKIPAGVLQTLKTLSDDLGSTDAVRTALDVLDELMERRSDRLQSD
jgi:hypothetical protein